MSRSPLIRTALVLAITIAIAVLLHTLNYSVIRTADAQSPGQLVPLVTDQTPMALANTFGFTQQSVINQAGDHVFIGNAGTGVYYRAAGAPSITPVLLMGDEVPGFPGSRNDLQGASLRLNNSGLLAWRPDFFTAAGVGQGAIFTFDGTTRQMIVSGADPAPGGGGLPYGRNLVIAGLNDAGDIAFTATLVPPGTNQPPQTTLYIVPAGGSPVRIAALGDSAPNGGGTYTTMTGLGFNNQGEVLFGANITNPSNAFGLYVATIGGPIRKVAAGGDPAPGGGPNLSGFVNALFNNSGLTFFRYGNVIYVNSAVGGSSRLAGSGDAVPAPVGGTLGTVTLATVGDNGDAGITSTISGGTSPIALFRVSSGNPMQIVAYANQPVPGLAGQNFSTSFTGTSINSTGLTSFRATLTGGPPAAGIFQQAGTNAAVTVALDGQPTSLPGGGNYTLAGQTTTFSLNNGSVFFRTDVVGGSADYAEVLSAGGVTNLLSSEDPLPAGSRIPLRTFRVGGSGDSVGFLTGRTGGRSSIGIHKIADQSTHIVMTDGDLAPGMGGARLRLTNRNTVFLNSNGTVLFSASLIAAPIGSGIFTAAPGGGMTKVAVSGESFGSFTITGPTLNLLTPSPINSAGQAVFRATLVPTSGPAVAAIMRWTPGGGLTKIAATGDVTSSGTITALPTANSVAINSAGEVLFVATTTGNLPGIYVGNGGTPAKVVRGGDAGPSGSTFSAFATPSFNDSGEVVFLAALTGGPSAGAFIGSTSGAPTALALNGAAAPAGGNFAITSPPRAEISINNQHDVVFRAALTGGTADSGYFMRRGPGGVLQAVLLQGDPAPGTLGVFDTILIATNNVVEENFQLSQDGDLAVQSSALVGGQRVLGVWHVKPDNTVEEISVRGTVGLEYGGGSLAISTPSFGWNSGGRFPIWARVSGGTFTDAILLFVPIQEINTPAGVSVPVAVVDSTTGNNPVSLTFANVTQAGETTLTTASGGPTVPTAFSLGDPPVFYNISTTATFNGTINVCIDFSTVSFPAGANLRLLHFDGTSWVDVTTSGPTNNVICGNVTSLSPFTVAQLTNQAPTADAGANQTLECNTHSGCTFTLDGTGSTDPDNDALTYVWKDGNGNVVGNAATISLTRLLGTYTFSLTVSDPLNQSSTGTTQVTVHDTTAPTLSVSVSPNQIWPANKLVEVSATISVNDACDPASLVKLISITSNEPLSTGDIQGANVNTDDRAFQLRARRAGGGSGRIYTITYRATDHSGNWVEATAQVLVPHDQGN